MTGRTRKLAAVGGLVAVAVVAGVVLLGGDDGADDPLDGGTGLGDVSLPDRPSAELSGLTAEVVELLDARLELTYHATYESEGGELGTVVIEELRDGPGRVRSDTRSTGEGAVETRRLEFDGRVVVCARPGDEDFTCTEETTESAGTLVGSVAEQLAGTVLTETDTTEVAGREARCFAFVAEDGEGELCLDQRGIPLRIAVGAVRLTLTALDDDVPIEAFVPPAEPTPGVTIEDPTVVDEAPEG